MAVRRPSGPWWRHVTALTEALVARYPGYGMLIGAKVAKSEMSWA